MKRTARVTATLAVLLAVAVTVGACGSNPPPAPSATSRPSGVVGATRAPAPTGTPSPGSSAPAAVATPPSTAASPSPTGTGASGAENLLPTPTTTDVVLLVGSPSALNDREQQWLSDLRAQLGNVGALAYRAANLEALRAYFVVFVIDQSAELDASALAEAYQAGLTIHLVGAASEYGAQISAGGAP